MTIDAEPPATNASKTEVEALVAEIADHLQALLDEGKNPGLVADAAIMAGASLRLSCTGPASLAAVLSTLSKRFAFEAAATGAGNVN